MSSNSARLVPWFDPTGECDHIGCSSRAVLHAELTSPGSEYSAETDLCIEHMGEIVDQARAFVVAIGAAAPETVLERNVAAVTAEHIERSAEK